MLQLESEFVSFRSYEPTWDTMLSVGERKLIK